ncbi:MAG: hypothetical protein KAI50_08160 [Desulfobacterales bacterium]|nr:hypothetical protein [Desulfobacterales bacterium]
MHTHFSHFKPQIWSKTYQKYPDVDPKILSMTQDFGLIEGLTKNYPTETLHFWNYLFHISID